MNGMKTGLLAAEIFGRQTSCHNFLAALFLIRLEFEDKNETWNRGYRKIHEEALEHNLDPSKK